MEGFLDEFWDNVLDEVLEKFQMHSRRSLRKTCKYSWRTENKQEISGGFPEEVFVNFLEEFRKTNPKYSWRTSRRNSWKTSQTNRKELFEGVHGVHFGRIHVGLSEELPETIRGSIFRRSFWKISLKTFRRNFWRTFQKI